MNRPSVRDKIIEAGLELVYAHGFNGCSVQDITEAAGVPKGSFYNYFKSKEALAVEILGAYVQLKRDDFATLAEETKSPLERVHAYFKLLSRQFKSTGYQRGCLMGNLGSELSDSSEPIREALAKRFAHWHRTIADLLREAQSTGEVNQDLDADQLARFLVSSWQGALTQMKVSKSKQPLEDFLELAFAPLRASAAR